jgi:OHCU decarboxylase
MRLNALNDCAPDLAYRQFIRCCGSSTWARRMEQARPFRSISELEEVADRIWATCSCEDWYEAFAAHPRIGQQSCSPWSQQEQSVISNAPATLHAVLVEANRKYEAKFGYIFIICATDKTASEMLIMLQQRLHNDDPSEILIAGEQQRLITQIRLRKLLSE